IQTAVTLGLLGDPRAVPVLVGAARDAAFFMGGSENATIHGIYQHTLSQALARLTGLEGGLKDRGQDPEGLRAFADRAAEGWKVTSRKLLAPTGPRDGRPTAGLQLRQVTDRAVYRAGELPEVTVVIRNVSGRPWRVCKHPAFYTRYLTTDSGAEVRRAS